MTSKDSTSKASRWTALLAALFLYAVFLGLSQTATGYDITYFVPFTLSSAGEVYFWLAHALLLVPAGCLLGFAAAGLIGPLFEKIAAQWRNPARRKILLTFSLLFILAVVVARLGHYGILLDYPCTDEEYSVQFGGQVLAMGKAKIPAPQPLDAFPWLYLYYQKGWITSIDWLGPQLAWCVAEVTGLGAWVFALAAALPVPCLGYILGRRLNPAWGLVGAVLFLFSPMAFAMSLTTHAQLLSRAMLAVTLVCYVTARIRPGLYTWLLTGLAFGASCLCRPVETVVLTLPLWIDLLMRVIRREPGQSRAFLAVLMGCAGPFLIFMWHNFLVTGDPLIPARFQLDVLLGEGSGENVFKLFDQKQLWERFGANTGYNLFMLAIWFLGPLGVVLVMCGVMTDTFTKELSVGVFLALLVGLLHDNQGLHIVGPIHYTECAVPLIIIATHGLARVAGKLKDCGAEQRVLASVLVGVLVLGLGTFNTWNSLALRKQSRIQADIYAALENSGIHNAAVLAPRFWQVWGNVPEFEEVRTWVFEWRRPKPKLDDDILILVDKPEAHKALRKLFPDRTFYRMALLKKRPYMVLIPMKWGGSRGGSQTGN